jgi:hypothetical protein
VLALWYAIYFAVHLLLYVVVLRRLPAFRQERTIFAYHALSALAVTVVAVVGLFTSGAGPDFEWAVAVIAFHGIYSTTFLELWSLSEGGYSLQILEHIERAERRGERADIEALRAIGAAKLANRLSGLTGAGLVRDDGGRLSLTGFGRLVGTVFALLAWLTNTRDGV